MMLQSAEDIDGDLATQSPSASAGSPDVLTSPAPSIDHADFQGTVRRSRWQRTRAFFRWMVSHRYFDRAVLCIIGVNCVTLLLNNPLDDERYVARLPEQRERWHPNKERQDVLRQFDYFFTVAFVLEMLCKWVALGLWNFSLEAEMTTIEIMSSSGNVKRRLRKRKAHEGATDVMQGAGYFQNSWNMLDFVVVVESLMSVAMELSNQDGGIDLSALRTVRVLRPLRTINHLPGLKMMVRSVIESLPMLVHSLVGFLMYFLIFDILGTQLFAGSLFKRCFSADSDGRWVRATDSDIDGLQDRLCGGAHSCTVGQTCRRGDLGSGYYWSPNQGATSFDNVGWASLVLMQGITLEGWSEVMYFTQDAVASASWIYFLPMVVLGAFIMLNLVLAVIVTKFKESAALLREEVRLTKLRRYEVYFLGLELRKKHTAFARWKDRAYALKKMEDTAREDAIKKRITEISAPITKVASRASGLLTSGLQRFSKLSFSKVGQVVPLKRATAARKSSRAPNSVERVSAIAEDLEEDERTSSCLSAPISKHQLCSQALDATRGTIEHARQRAIEMADQAPNSSNDAQVIHKNQQVSVKLQKRNGKLVMVSVEEGNRTFLRSTCRRLVEAKWFDRLIMSAILLNTLTMALERYSDVPGKGTIGNNANEKEKETLEQCNTVFFWIFLIEMFMKLVAYTVRGYVRDAFNCFDGFVVLVSVVERVILSGVKTSVSGLRVIRVFRLFRVLRIARLARRMKFMMFVFRVMSKSFESAGWVSMLLLLFSLIFSVLGMQLFAGRFIFDVNTGLRNNFDTLLMAFITVFQVLSGEDWHRVMHKSMHETNAGASLYFVTWVWIGQFILLNIFLAVMLQVSDEKEEVRDRFARKAGKRRSALAVEWIKGHFVGWRKNILKPAQRKVHTRRITKALNDRAKSRHTNSVQSLRSPCASIDDNKSIALDPLRVSSFKPRRSIIDMVTFEESDEDDEIAGGPADEAPIWGDDRPPSVQPRRLSVRERFRNSVSTPLIGYWRRNAVTFAVKFVRHPRFDHFVLLLIVTSSVCLALESPRTANDAGLMNALRVLDVIFTMLFTLEVILKSIAMGFVTGLKPYLSNNWNRLDFFVVLTSWINLIFTWSGMGGEFGYVRALRMLRCLRPLRMISRYPGMKKVVGALLLSFWPMINVIMVLMLVWLIFAIVGVQLFGGTMYHCLPSVESCILNGTHCVTSRTQCLSRGGVWTRHDSNFDDVLNSIMVLFTVSSLEGWPEIMWNAIDGTGSDYASLYFIFFILLGVFFFLNLFVLTIFRNFMYLKQTMDGVGFLTPEQQNWVDSQKRIMASNAVRRLKPPRSVWRLTAWRVVRYRWFEPFILSMIAINVMLMATVGVKVDDWEEILNDFNTFFVVVYTLEMLLKIVALHFSQYISDRWNQLDFALVVLSLADLAIGSIDGGAVLTVRILRLTRLIRVLRMVKRAEGLRRIFLTIYLALPSLVNVGSLLLLLFFIFAVLGVNLFGEVQFDVFVNDHANFRDVLVSALTLFRCTTGEGWQDIMYELRRTGPSPYTATAFFVVFLTLASYMLINLFVMVLIDTFDGVTTRASGMRDEHMSDFKECWGVLDPNASEMVHAYQVEALLRMLLPPLGVGPHEPLHTVLEVVDQLQLIAYDGKIEYHKTFLAIHNVSFGDVMEAKTKNHAMVKADNDGLKRRATHNFIHGNKSGGVGGKLRVMTRRLSSEFGLLKGGMMNELALLKARPTSVKDEVAAFRLQTWARAITGNRKWHSLVQQAKANSPKRMPSTNLAAVFLAPVPDTVLLPPVQQSSPISDKLHSPHKLPPMRTKRIESEPSVQPVIGSTRQEPLRKPARAGSLPTSPSATDVVIDLDAVLHDFQKQGINLSTGGSTQSEESPVDIEHAMAMARLTGGSV